MKRVLIISSFDESIKYVHEAIRIAAQQASESTAIGDVVECFRLGDRQIADTVFESILRSIHKADVVIADLSDSNPNVMYELGYTHALMKPTILIRRRMGNIAFDVQAMRFLYYGLDHSTMAEFIHELTRALISALTRADEWIVGHYGEQEGVRPQVFVSYSHKDIEYLDRLKVHMRPLERQNVIDLWDDTKIKAGAKWKKEIERALERAGIAILLVSADFLASDFIVDNELPPLLKAAEEKGTAILPVVLKPCRFVRDKSLSQFQPINDPSRPLQMLSDAEKEECYARICERIEQEVSR